ncbi:MAG: hypothetical protein U0636_05430 [Phycisphaerales bacterium]
MIGYAAPPFMARRTFVILSRQPSEEGILAPIGTRAQVMEGLAHCNTAPEVPTGDTLYGPGVEFELPPGQDPIRQMILTISDDDIAWVVIMRVAREFGWKVLDPTTGRELQP